MPNPLLQTYRDRSKKPPRNPGIAGVEEREIIIENPEMEHYAGANNAYRGTEQHGVKTDEHASIYDPGNDDAHHEDINPMSIEPTVQPIPVLVVNEYGKEERQFRAYQFLVQAQAQQIINAHPKRSRVTIRNVAQVSTSTGTLPSNIFLATTSSVNSGNGGTVNLPVTNPGWTGLMVTYTVSNLVLGAATDTRPKLQQTTDGTNWVDVPNSEKIFIANGTQTAFIPGPVSSRVRLAWTVTAGPVTSETITANVILFPIDVSDTVVGNPVYIGGDATLSLITGYRLDPGNELTLDTETEVWAMCAPGLQSSLQILDQYSVQLP